MEASIGFKWEASIGLRVRQGQAAMRLAGIGSGGVKAPEGGVNHRKIVVVTLVSK